MEARGNDSLHIIVFPWLAFGHMLPFLDLSKSLARRGHRISFISTPRNIQRLPKIPFDVSHLINLIPLTLPQVEGKPENAEATSDLPMEDHDYLRKALDGLEQSFADFIQNSSPKPDWIIQDFFQHWIPKLATESGVPSISFSIFGAAALTIFGHPAGNKSRGIETFTASPPWVPFPSKVFYRLHEILQMAAGPHRPNPVAATANERMELAIVGSSAVAIRSCEELEGDWLPVVEQIYKKPLLPVGLLPPLVNERSDHNSNTNTAEAEILEWLDGRKSAAGSVVYVALGSEVTMSMELLQELALGLELAGLPFLWALRRPLGSSHDMKILPEGFEERTREYGKVVMGWVPQLKVLAHAAVGGFLTHCGWGSIIESLHFGHPLVLMPVTGDQGLNARMLEEKGIGVEVERNFEDGSFTRNEVAKALKLIMVEEEGGSYRKKAQEAKAFANKECQEKYLDNFVDYLLTHKTSHC